MYKWKNTEIWNDIGSNLPKPGQEVLLAVVPWRRNIVHLKGDHLWEIHKAVYIRHGDNEAYFISCNDSLKDRIVLQIKRTSISGVGPISLYQSDFFWADISVAEQFLPVPYIPDV